MKKLFVHHDPLLAGYVHATLESNGIDALLKNNFLTGAVGELPPTATWPEIWIIHDVDFDRAAGILQSILTDE